MKKIFLVLSLFLMVSACATKIKPIGGNIPVNTDIQKIELAIKNAAADRGWIVKSAKPGAMELALDVRSHSVVVDVKYDTSNYTIIYKDSQNMDYSSIRNSIHKKYNNWVMNLRQSINQFLQR